MARGLHGEALQHVRMLFDAGAVGGLTDRQLLERFRAREGEAAELAFAALVERHGPMILRVCRRALRDEHNAQDAFQATFLVLVRKAGSLHTHDSIGGWLHAVACRVAACARTAQARRRAHERRAAAAAPASTRAGNDSGDDLGAVLHEEIGRLPERYRTAVVLCDLEGLTQDQAAQRLGCPSGTVRSRLARGRVRLQARLTRRGMAPAGGALATVLAAEVASAAVPAELVTATVRAATLTGPGQTAVVAAFTDGVLRAMFMSRLKMISAVILVIGVGVSGTAGLSFLQAAGRSGEVTAQASADAKPRAPTDVEDEIGQLRRELERAQERFAWADRMFEKGYVSKAQYQEDARWLEHAQAALDRRRAELREQGKALVDRPAEKRNHEEIRLLTDLNRLWDRSFFDREAELAGLPPYSRPAILDWEQAYALALIRSRSGQVAQGRGLVEAIDPKTLAQQAERYGVADFARFRQEFLAGPSGEGGNAEFRDPASEILELLRQHQQFENSRGNIAAMENMIKVLRDLIQKVSSGLSQLQLDQVDVAVQRARSHMVDERQRYRDQLDALKPGLGLSPHAPVALGKGDLAGFRKAFQDADLWCADPKGHPVDLPRIAGQLPTLTDVVIEGHSAAAVVMGDVKSRPSEEEFLAGAARAALANKTRESDATGLELRVRAATRRLLRIRLAYEIEKRSFVLLVRRRSQAQEQLLAPPRREESRPQRADLIPELIGIQGQILANQDRLVSLWSEHQTVRLALFRDLGELPCNDWKSFYDQLGGDGP
jgi:RNA polymerase sigma factor (sigma-70 family)